MKQFQFSYRLGVAGMSTTKTENIYAESEFQAEKKFKDKFKTQMSSKGLDSIQVLHKAENDLPALTPADVQNAERMFVNSENPCLEYQIMRLEHKK